MSAWHLSAGGTGAHYVVDGGVGVCGIVPDAAVRWTAHPHAGDAALCSDCRDIIASERPATAAKRGRR